MAGWKQSPERKSTPERETTAFQQRAVLLKPGREVVRTAGLTVTSRTLDSPEAVATASIYQLRTNPMLWAAYNRGREFHKYRIQLAAKRGQMSAIPTPPLQVQVQELPTPITQNESVPSPPPVLWPGINPHPEAMGWTQQAENQWWEHHNEQRQEEVTSEATTPFQPPKSPIEMLLPSSITGTPETNTAPTLTTANPDAIQPQLGPLNLCDNKNECQRIRDIERLREYQRRKRQQRLKNVIISHQYQLSITSQPQYSQSPPLREEPVVMETNEPTLEVPQTSTLASVEHVVSHDTEPIEIDIISDQLLYGLGYDDAADICRDCWF